MYVDVRPDGVFTDICPREVRLYAARCFGDKGDGASGSNGSRFVVAWGERKLGGDPDGIAQKLSVECSVRIKLRESTFLESELNALYPGLSSYEAHHLVHKFARFWRAIGNMEF